MIPAAVSAIENFKTTANNWCVETDDQMMVLASHDSIYDHDRQLVISDTDIDEAQTAAYKEVNDMQTTITEWK